MIKTKITIHLAIISCGLLWGASFASAADYYVDASYGNDGASGLSPQSAWQSIAKVNSSQFQPGSRILFKRGEVWRGQITLASGTAGQPVTYSSYGIAVNKPTILGSLNKSNISDWIQEAGNIWKSSSAFNTDVGNLIFNGGADFGRKKWDFFSLASQGDYWLDRSSRILRIYSVGNPATFYSDIECALRNHIINQDNASYVIIDGLALKYGAAHGVGGANTQHITIRNMDISYIGGGDLRGDGSNVRYGNGVEFWGNAHDNVVERNRIWEIYDTCLTNQNHTQTVNQYNITYKNNVMWNCGLASFEYWNRPASSQTFNIRFENNTAVNAGWGWGGAQRPDSGGAHILSHSNVAVTNSIYVRNNVFYQAKYAAVVIAGDAGYKWTETGMILDYNCWYQSDPAMKLAELYDKNAVMTMFTAAQFSNYQAFIKQDAHSMLTDPLFLDLSQSDFHLAPSSSCVDRGVNAGISDDFDGKTRPQDVGFDIGAFEYAPDVTPPSTVFLRVNGNPDAAVTVSNPVTVDYTLRGGAGQEFFYALDAPALGLAWSYFNAAGQWVPVPEDVTQLTPFATVPPDGNYLFYSGSVPAGNYLLCLGFDTTPNGHLDAETLIYDCATVAVH